MMQETLRCVGMSCACGAFALAAFAPRTAAATDGHPFILWTTEEAAATRKKVETESWAKQVAKPLAGSAKGRGGLENLFSYIVLGDKAAGEAEKRALLESLAAGKPRGDFVTPLRYDGVYDLLSPSERESVERAFRAYIDMAMESMTKRKHNRWNWLPNLGYPWYVSAHLMAASLRDKALARRIFEGPFGLKWYFDEYLSDLGFYNEEFAKMYNTPDGILLWCRACERLGLGEIGFGYRGRQGATPRGHIESVVRIGMPGVDLGTGRWYYPRLSIGDAKQNREAPTYGFQHPLVSTYLGDTYVGRPSSPWGLGEWVWFEMAHAQWPDAGFGYFLAERRAPGDDAYHPTLLFGLDPVDPKKAAPPPAPSGVYPGRGLVVLRAEEGPAYWTSPAPAVGLRLATPYAHHVQDCFCLTGFYAFHRPLYVNRQHSTNYSGVDPGYSNSSRSHTTVLVDFEEPKTIGEAPVRHDLNPLVKFVAARGKGIFEGVDQTRALMLTREYLLDISRLASDRPRNYLWLVQAIGHAHPDEPGRWTPSRDLVGHLFNLDRERSLATDRAWSVSAVQSSAGAHRGLSAFGPRWFEDRIGSRVTMLGEPGTTAYAAWAPVVQDTSGTWKGKDRFCYGEDEPAAAAIVACRKAPRTTFVAVHEPFRTHHRLAAVDRIAQDDRAVALRIVGLDEKLAAVAFTDYLMLRLGDEAEKPIALGGAGAQVRFTDYAYVRVDGGGARAAGGLSGLAIPLGGAPAALVLNGKPQQAESKGGWLIFGDAKAPAQPEPVAPAARPTPGPIAARWMPESAVCLPTGGQAARPLRLRNAGLAPVSARILLRGSKGLKAEPAAIDLKGFAPGKELDVTVTFSAAPETANVLLRVRLEAEGGALDVEPAELDVAHGVINRRSQVWPADFAQTVYSPRYIAKVYYMESGATGLLLDPKGYRRSDSTGVSYPTLVRLGGEGEEKKRSGGRSNNVPKFAYFIPVVVPGREGKPGYVYEAGQHAHGARSSVEHRFTEDWIAVRFRDGKPGERIAFDWLPPLGGPNGLDRTILGREPDLAAKKMPGKMLVATPDGKVHDAGGPESIGRAKLPKDASAILAAFHRPHGYEHGSAIFYPPDSKCEGGLVTQPADQPSAFTFCLEEDFAGLASRWQKSQPPSQPTPEELSIYGAAFMPHLEK